MKNKKASNKQQARDAIVAFTAIGWEDYQHWRKEDPKLCDRINDLIDACIAEPFKGIGKPEPLKGNLTGLWSRRIDLEHRMVYAVGDGMIYVVSCRYHY
jgi:toxin YoeB